MQLEGDEVIDTRQGIRPSEECHLLESAQLQIDIPGKSLERKLKYFINIDPKLEGLYTKTSFAGLTALVRVSS